MEQKQKDALWAQYSKQTHVLGRVLSILTVALLLGAPFVIGGLLGAYPDLGATARGFLSVGLVWTVSSVAEFLIYTPMLGAGGGYLAFITGNLINMKIPCAPAIWQVSRRARRKTRSCLHSRLPHHRL